MAFLVPEHFILYVGIFNLLLLILSFYFIAKSKTSTSTKIFRSLISVILPIIGSIVIIIISSVESRTYSNLKV